MNDNPYAAKIAALLAKAEDPAATPEEAQTYSEKAEALMVKWGVSDAMAAAARGGSVRAEKIVERVHTIHHRYYQAEVMLVHNIATGVGTIKVLKRDLYNHTSRVYLIGYESDLDRVETLWHSLWLQATSAVDKWWKPYRKTLGYTPKSSEVFNARRNFLLSFGSAVRVRLREMYAKEEANGEPGTALALVDRGKQVDDRMAEMYPNTKSARGLKTGWTGRTEGHAAGKKANIGQSGVTTGRKGELH